MKWVNHLCSRYCPQLRYQLWTLAFLESWTSESNRAHSLDDHRPRNTSLLLPQLLATSAALKGLANNKYFGGKTTTQRHWSARVLFHGKALLNANNYYLKQARVLFSEENGEHYLGMAFQMFPEISFGPEFQSTNLAGKLLLLE